MPPSESNSNQTDVQHWVQLKEGSEFALSKLIKKYFNPLQNYAYKFNQDEDFIKDCVQEVFIEIWQKRDRINIPDSVKAYLLGSVRNKIFREISRTKIVKDNSEIDLENNDLLFENSVEWGIIEDETNAALEKKMKDTLNSLPQRQREVLYLHYYQNLSREEIAEILQINNQSVSNLTQRAFKAVREQWGGNMALLISLLEVSKILFDEMSI
jgi:RNA polymerase sigma factor (sigma-70 family)